MQDYYYIVTQWEDSAWVDEEGNWLVDDHGDFIACGYHEDFPTLASANREAGRCNARILMFGKEYPHKFLGELK